LSQLAEVKETKSKLMAELEEYRECDPEVLEQIQKQVHTAKEAANRWTGTLSSMLTLVCYI